MIAKEHGWFDHYGVDVTLVKENSWATIRDKVAIGLLDGAQMLAPMPLAMSLAVGPICTPMVTSLSLGLNGNAITVSKALYQQMKAGDPQALSEYPLTAKSLLKLISTRRQQGLEPLTFAHVFPYSTHNYQLRYWLAAAGINPDYDVRLVVVPPAQMVGQLAHGIIDGFCVGEPWNSQALQTGVGATLISSYEIWNNGPEKVLGVTKLWAEHHPQAHRALIMALLEACRWLDQPHNRHEAASLISKSGYIDLPTEVVQMSLEGICQYGCGEARRTVADFNLFHRYAANYPWRSHAIWLITQMVRWGQLPITTDIATAAEQVYQPDLYREAAEQLGVIAPGVDYKLEGHHSDCWSLDEGHQSIVMGSDRFYDGGCFDPANPIDYVQGFKVQNMSHSTQAATATRPILLPNQPIVAANPSA